MSITTPPLLIKLGGSIITHKTKPYTPNLPGLNRLAAEIASNQVTSLGKFSQPSVGDEQ